MSRVRLAALLAGATMLTGVAAVAQEAAPAPTGPVTLVHAGSLLDRPGTAPRGNATLVIRDGKVAEVRDGFVQPADIGAADARVVDLKSAFVLPGLIDVHVHLAGQLGPNDQLRDVVDDREDLALNGAYYAEKTLQAGFTTVRDLGAGGRSILSLREAIEAGRLPGPTVLAVGHMVSISAGHGDRANGWNHEVAEALATSDVCNGPDDCRRAVREQVRLGADAIKLATTGGVLSQIAAGTGQQMFDDEIKAIVETAHLLGKKVSSHAHAAGGVNAALRAGVDSVEHGSYLDEESIKLFRQTGAYLVPTLLAGQTVVDMANKGGLTPATRRKALTVGPVMMQSFQKAVKGGVRIAFGTDNGVGPHGTNAREFKLMVDAGLPPAEAIKAATVNAADLLDRKDRIGTLEPGRDADIIAVAKSPLDDVTELERVRFVMRRGVVHKLNGERVVFQPVP
ncbi:MAG TPA: amidohydrolase family protein [Azospirillaceae bacterium]|nr:amidohydrolase family protein [Azospirillaceae bacterium]